MNLLMVEDDRDLASSISDYLQLDGIVCDHAYSGTAGLKLALAQHYDVILLDITLPKMNGLHVCEHLRAQGNDTPILMLTARDTLEDKLAGFQVGTDDYLVKPFDIEELVVRVQALSQRRSGQVKQLTLGDLHMDLARKTVTRQGQTLSLTPTAWKILEILLRAAPHVVSRAALSAALWSDEPPDSNVLKAHLYNLRKQLDKPFSTALLHTVAGHGFVLRVEPYTPDA